MENNIGNILSSTKFWRSYLLESTGPYRVIIDVCFKAPIDLETARAHISMMVTNMQMEMRMLGKDFLYPYGTVQPLQGVVIFKESTKGKGQRFCIALADSEIFPEKDLEEFVLAILRRASDIPASLWNTRPSFDVVTAAYDNPSDAELFLEELRRLPGFVRRIHGYGVDYGEFALASCNWQLVLEHAGLSEVAEAAG